ncbi:MAG: hypothetical protein U0P46_09845 [Holophagaceae bacterium]
MSKTIDQLKAYRMNFGLVFAVSTLILFLIVLSSLNVRDSSKGDGDVISVGSGINFSLLISLASLVTSFASLCGIAITSIIAYRKEKRERAGAEIDNEKKKLEIEKLRLELEKSHNKERDLDSKIK